jgi:protein SCO1
VQASNHQIGSVVDTVLLLCCQYNPTTGKYDFFVSRLLAIAGFVTILVFGGFFYYMFRTGKRVDTEKSDTAKAS